MKLTIKTKTTYTAIIAGYRAQLRVYIPANPEGEIMLQSHNELCGARLCQYWGVASVDGAYRVRSVWFEADALDELIAISSAAREEILESVALIHDGNQYRQELVDQANTDHGEEMSWVIA